MLVRTEVRIEKHVLKLVRSDVRIEKACLKDAFVGYLAGYQLSYYRKLQFFGLL
jgi:hypothetical protein